MQGRPSRGWVSLAFYMLYIYTFYMLLHEAFFKDLYNYLWKAKDMTKSTKTQAHLKPTHRNKKKNQELKA